MTDSILRSYQFYTHTSLVPYPAPVIIEGLASDFLAGETDGFAFDATSYDTATAAAYVGGPVGGTVAVINTGDPTDNLDDVPLSASNLVQASTSAKVVVFPDAPIVRWSPHNILLQSQDATATGGTGWQTLDNVTFTADDTTAPDGTVTADKILETSANSSHSVDNYGGSTSVAASAAYTTSVYLKAIGSQQWMGLSTDNGGTAFQHFDIANGAVGSSFGGVGGSTFVSSSIVNAGSGWWRCIITYVGGGATGTRLTVATTTGDGTGGTHVGNTSNGFYIWGAQVCRGYNANPYVATTSATRRGIPQSYDAAGAMYGVLLERAATNLALYSDDFTNAAWTKSNMTTAKTATGPDDGSNSASTLTATAGNATALQAITSANDSRITSFWVKRRTGSGNIDLTQDNGSTWQTMTVTSAWTRVSLTVATLTNPTVGIRIVTNADAIDVWGFQHELYDLTSTIPTLGVSVTRAADEVYAPTTTVPTYTSLSAYSYVKGISLDPTGGRIALINAAYQAGSGGVNDTMLHTNLSTVLTYFVGDNGSVVVNNGSVAGFPAAGVAAKAGLRNALNDSNYALNGAIGTVDTTCTVPATSITRIGFFYPSYNGHKFIYYLVVLPRAMNDAQLQAATT